MHPKCILPEGPAVWKMAGGVHLAAEITAARLQYKIFFPSFLWHISQFSFWFLSFTNPPYPPTPTPAYVLSHSVLLISLRLLCKIIFRKKYYFWVWPEYTIFHLRLVFYLSFQTEIIEYGLSLSAWIFIPFPFSVVANFSMHQSKYECTDPTCAYQGIPRSSG